MSIPIHSTARFKFNGKEFDEETGNYYYSARYYNPKWSIFISVDPLAERTMDAYGYCYQNPVKLVDPMGMSADGWIENISTGEITLDDCAKSQETTPDGYKYRGEETEQVTGGMRTLYQSDGSQVSGIPLAEVVITNPDPWEGTYFDESNYSKGYNIYSPYIPDGFGVTLNGSVSWGFFTYNGSISSVIDSRNNVALFGTYGPV